MAAGRKRKKKSIGTAAYRARMPQAKTLLYGEAGESNRDRRRRERREISALRAVRPKAAETTTPFNNKDPT